ncbi:MAG: hypothetical protein K6B68_18090 [Eubacterium sp.]|nr:hypothetical protein [Eubacterium sp.]
MKRRKIYFIILLMLLLSIGGCSKETSDSSDTMSEAEYEQKLQEAETTPYGKQKHH